MRYLIYIFLFAVLSGCTTVEFERKDLVPEKKATLRYPPQTDSKREAEYRAELDRQARAFCGGDFSIDKEYQAKGERASSRISTGFGTGMGVGAGSSVFIGGVSARATDFHFVDISCAKP